VLLLHLNLILKCSLFDGFSIRFNDNPEVAYFLLGHPVHFAFKICNQEKNAHPGALLDFKNFSSNKVV